MTTEIVIVLVLAFFLLILTPVKFPMVVRIIMEMIFYGVLDGFPLYRNDRCFDCQLNR